MREMRASPHVLSRRRPGTWLVFRIQGGSRQFLRSPWLAGHERVQEPVQEPKAVSLEMHPTWRRAECDDEQSFRRTVDWSSCK